MILEWERFGVIRPRAKWTASILMTLMVSYPIIFGGISLILKVAAIVTVIGALAYIWTRPSECSSLKAS